MENISKKEARRLALFTQGLWGKSPFGRGKNGVDKMLQRLSYVQIDSISVIERAHHHIIRSRVANYQASMLDDLQVKNRRTFEYWSHAAAYLPIDDFRYSLPRMHHLREDGFHWFEREPKIMAFVLDRIRAEGPLRAKDFAAPPDHKGGTWWNWKPAKKALEQQFMEGRLMVVRREKFQKLYDLTERVLPTDIGLSLPTIEETARHLIRQTIHALGFCTETEITYLRKRIKPFVKKVLPEMQEAGEIMPLQVEGLTDNYFTIPEIIAADIGKAGSRKLHILSPFDNLIIRRARTTKLFDFDYQLECYVPGPKRKYGYFVLPLLWGDRFVGRMDCKAERKEKKLLIRNLVIEPDARLSETLIRQFAKSVWEFAGFCGCDHVELQNIVPQTLRDAFQNSLQKIR